MHTSAWAMLASSVQAVVACNCAEGLHFSAFHYIYGADGGRAGG